MSMAASMRAALYSVRSASGPSLPTSPAMLLDARTGASTVNSNGIWTGTGNSTVSAGTKPFYMAAGYNGGPAVRFSNDQQAGNPAYVGNGYNLKIAAPSWGDIGDMARDWSIGISFTVDGRLSPFFSDYSERIGANCGVLSAGTSASDPASIVHNLSNINQLSNALASPPAFCYGTRQAFITYNASTHTLKTYNHNILLNTKVVTPPTARGVLDYYLGVAGGQTLFPMDGEVQMLGVWTREVSAAEVSSGTLYMRQAHLISGKQVGFVGNSWLTNNYSEYPWCEETLKAYWIANSVPITGCNLGVGSVQWSDLENGNSLPLFNGRCIGAALGIDQLLPSARPGLLFCLEDINTARTKSAALTQADAVAYCTNRKARGWTVALLDMPPTDPALLIATYDQMKAIRIADFPTPHPTVPNVYLPGPGITYADYRVAITELAQFDASTDCTNLTYYNADKTHPRSAANVLVGGVCAPLLTWWVAQ
jgi:hypothetical protein